MNIERPIDFVEENSTPIDEEFGTSVTLEEDTESSIQESFMATGQDVTPNQAKQMLFESANPIEALIRDKFYTEEMKADELQKAYDRATFKSNDFLENPDFFYEQAKSLANDDVSPIDIRAAVNLRTEQRILEELSAQEETGIVDRVLDFGSYVLRESTVGVPETLTDRTERLGTEMLFNRLNMSPSEYKAWFQETTSEIMQEGLRENDANKLDWLKSVVANNGYDSESNINKAFALLDLAGLGELAGVGFKAARVASKPATRIARIVETEGPEAAAEIGEGILARNVDPEVSTDLGPRVVNPHAPTTATPEGWYSRALRKNTLAEDVRSIYESGAMGRVVDNDTLRATVTTTVDNFVKRVGNPVYKSDLETTGFGNYTVNIQLGKSVDGTPYKPTPSGEPSTAVQRLAEKTGGEIVEVRNSADDLQGYVVQHRQNIDLTGEIEAIDPDELLRMERGAVRDTLGKVFGNTLMGSTALRGVDRLTTLAQMGEASQSAVKGVFQREAKKINALGPTERANLASIVGKLRDDPVEASRRGWYTQEEFSNRYQQLTGKTPDQKVIDAYDAEVAISNTAAVVRANNIMRTYVQQGYRAVEMPDGIRVPAKSYPKSKIDSNDMILDLNNNVRLLKSEIDEGVDIWKLDRDDQGVRYVAYPKKVDALEPQDVMGFNAGGPRTNPNANYFVVLGREGKFPKSLLTAFAEGDAQTAVQQLNTIQRALKEGATDIDDVIASNNDWNPAITSLDDLRTYSVENGWDLEDGIIAYKERNSYVQDVDADDATYKMAFSDYIEKEMSRQDSVLPEFGGQKSYNLDPMDTITQQFGTAVQELAQHAYTYNAMVGWVKKAQKAGVDWFPAGVSPNDYRSLFMEAKITGNTAFDRRMREVRNIEMRRMGIKSEAAQTMDNLGQQLSEFIFQKTSIPTRIGDPTNALLNIGFQSAFGFFNVSQAIIQSSHAATIMAISPRHGFRGSSMTLTMRSLYHKSPEVVDLATQRLAKYYGMEVDEIKEIMEYVRTSGRDVIDAEAVEQGTGVAWGISGFGGESYNPSTLRKAWLSAKKATGKGLDLALIPFNQGERLGRLTGTYTAILEFKAKNPGVSILSDRARMWISRRDQDLTFNMTAVGRPQIQSGLMRVPTQWLSHTFRAMESMFVGRNFTKAERIRMFAVMMPMYGTAGFGMASAAGSLAEYLGVEEDSTAFTFLKWGMIDGITDLLLEDTEGRVGTGLAGRLAPAGAIVETYRKIKEGQFLEVVGGPSGGIAGGIGDAFLEAYASLRDNRGTMLTEDIVKILRQPSGLDNIAKAYGIFNNGIYRSKNGITIPGEMGTTEGILQLLGIGSLKQAEWYDAKNRMFTSGKKLTKFRKEVNTKAEYAFDLLKGDTADKEKAFKLFNELKVMVDMSGFSPEIQTSLKKSINRRLDDQFFNVYEQLLRQDQDAEAERLRATLGR
jgi:hypothetical protein